MVRRRKSPLFTLLCDEGMNSDYCPEILRRTQRSSFEGRSRVVLHSHHTHMLQHGFVTVLYMFYLGDALDVTREGDRGAIVRVCAGVAALAH